MIQSIIVQLDGNQPKVWLGVKPDKIKSAKTSHQISLITSEIALLL
jgi:hypothetical protein